MITSWIVWLIAFLSWITPTSIDLPTIDQMDAQIIEVGFDAQGGMEAPHNPYDVGWWKYGAVAGEPGNAIYAAHVAMPWNGEATRGVFWDLKNLQVGDPVKIGRYEWVVSEVEIIEKNEIDLEYYFLRNEGEPQVVFFTCGGAWQNTANSYDSNVVVTLQLS